MYGTATASHSSSTTDQAVAAHQSRASSTRTRSRAARRASETMASATSVARNGIDAMA